MPFPSFLWQPRQGRSPPALVSPVSLPPSLTSSTPCVSFVITLRPDLFILSITALLFSPPSLLLQNIFHLITGCSAGVVESLVCWGVRCTMGSQTCNPPESLSALHIWQAKQNSPHITETFLQQGDFKFLLHHWWVFDWTSVKFRYILKFMN